MTNKEIQEQVKYLNLNYGFVNPKKVIDRFEKLKEFVDNDFYSDKYKGSVDTRYEHHGKKISFVPRFQLGLLDKISTRSFFFINSIKKYIINELINLLEKSNKEEAVQLLEMLEKEKEKLKRLHSISCLKNNENYGFFIINDSYFSPEYIFYPVENLKFFLFFSGSILNLEKSKREFKKLVEEMERNYLNAIKEYNEEFKNKKHYIIRKKETTIYFTYQDYVIDLYINIKKSDKESIKISIDMLNEIKNIIETLGMEHVQYYNKGVTISKLFYPISKQLEEVNIF